VHPALEVFELNRRAVFELMKFDELVLGLPIQQLERVAERQRRHKLAAPLTVDKPLALLRNVRTNESLKHYFEAMYNQCLVLLVSHFGSAVRALFVDGIRNSLRHGATSGLLREEIRATVAELRRLDGDISDFVAGHLADRKDLSFQDMQSIGRAFKDYLGYRRARDQTTNDIITGQACRNAIVHNGARVDRRLMNQLANAEPRSVRRLLLLDERISFSPDEVEAISKAMSMYLTDVSKGIETARQSLASADSDVVV
jgi:hypothetical protein